MSFNPNGNSISAKIFENSYPPEQLVRDLLVEWKALAGDVAFFLPHLADLNMRASISEYRIMRPGVSVLNETVVGPIRHGKVISCFANKDVFSFGLRILDEAVEVENGGESSRGAYRSFAMLDVHGNLYDGWRNLTIEGDLEEEEREMLASEVFINPDRHSHFYEPTYLLSKLAIARLSAQAKAIRREIDRLRAEGFGENVTRSPVTRAEYQSIRVETLLAEVDSDFQSRGTFPLPEANAEDFEKFRQLYNRLTYSLIPALRYYTRVIEYAFYKNGAREDGWENVRVGRTDWKLRHIEDLNLRYRIMEKSTRISV